MVFEYKIVLASSSPRRIELIKSIGLEFTQVTPRAKEEQVSDDPVETVEMNSFRKAESIMHQFPDSLIIGSDTVVYLERKILGKPVNDEDAERMLWDLSGKIHHVFTGVTIIDSKTGNRMTRHTKTSVLFKKLTENSIRNYIKSGEPKDKAGAYGIQGKGRKLIDRIDGSYTNVVGLPIELVSEMLEKYGVSSKKPSI